MATGVISVHGHGVSANPVASQLSLEHRAGSSRLENLTSQPITPSAFFPLTSPQKETPRLKTIRVEFSGGDVTVTSIALYLGSSTVFNHNISENATFDHEIPDSASASFTRSGISVGLGLDIPARKYIDFKFVSITTAGS